MANEDELVEAVRAAPAAADEALKAIQQNRADAPADLRALAAVAELRGADPAEFTVELLRDAGLLEAFEGAMHARGVEIGAATPRAAVPEAEAGFAGRLDIDEMIKFLERAKTFRCRIEVDNTFKGSGCLVGPGLVLTAWHVVRLKGPGIDQVPEPIVTVRLADGSRHEAAIPPSYASPCGDDEWNDRAPRNDAEVVSRHDVALLSLKTPAARHLGFARLPDHAPEVVSRSKVFLLDFPNGEDLELADGTTWKIRNVSSRLYHDVKTAAGSSGGACFDHRFQLLGLHQGGVRMSHQGKNVKQGRLVPLTRFRDDLAELIAADIAPRAVWHLDGQTTQLVIGRDLFADAVAEAGKENARVRGVRVMRRRPADADETGLGFSYRILSELLMRRGGEHVVVRIPLDQPIADLVSDISERVQRMGFTLAAVDSPGGVDAEQAAPEAAARELATRLVVAVNEAAAEAGRTVWFFIDNPSLVLVESARLQLEGLIAACLAQPRIRLVVTGLETVPLAGLEFSSPAAADGDGPAGLVVDYIGTFTRDDLLDCLTRAGEELAGGVAPGEVQLQADLALQGLASFNGAYDDVDFPTVVAALQDYLQFLRSRGGAG
ncbi:trypsin-like serine peptidase [Agromyces sp. NPDC004153]